MATANTAKTNRDIPPPPFPSNTFWHDKQGGDDLVNLALACPACNVHKYMKQAALTPLTRKVVPLFNPRTQIWEEHFVWDETRTQILGLTPTGRATVKCLKMNRVESVNLRMVLVAFEKHPPK